MSQPSQLLRDLQKEADGRLVKWIEDTLMRAEIAGLSSIEVHSMIMSCLFHQMVLLWRHLKVGPAEAGRTTAQLYQDYLNKLKEIDSLRSNKHAESQK